jgi:CheY-specific phosphatase CheX
VSANIQFIQRSGLLVLHIPGKADEKDFATIPDMIAERLGMPGTPPLSAIVVDLVEAQDMNESTWTHFAGLLGKIPGRNKFLVVNAPAATQTLITSKAGNLTLDFTATVDEVFSRLSTKRAAAPKSASEAPKPKTAEDVVLEKLLISTFQDAALKTLGVQCSTVFKAGEAYLKTPQNKVIHDIAASMGMMSKTVSGSVALGFKESTFLKIMGKMLGEEYTAITQEVEDGCGELLNIIFGQAKRVFNDNGHLFGKTLPTIFIGQSLRVRQLTPNPAFIIPFESDLGQMVIELGYRRT